MSRIILFSLLLAAGLWGCGHNHEGENNGSHHDHEKEQVSDNETVQESSLALNNGAKWVINDEMKPHLQASEKLLQEYNGNDHKTLAEGLKNNNNKLISSCTMKGESHEQLHVWLYPHIELVKKLEGAGSEEEADHIVEELRLSFNTFKEHFE